MATSNDVIVTLKLNGSDRFKSDVNSALGTVSEGSATATKKASMFGTVGSVAFKAVAAAALAVTAAMVTVISKSTMVAARTETLGVAMEAVAKATGTSLEALKEQEKILKKQGITTQESRRILMLFMQSQLDVADATKIARVAQDLAVISGENSSQTAATLTEAIANQNVMMLRQYGIVTTSDGVFRQYAATLGKTVEQLTETEKRTAFMNTILEQGSRVAGTYEMAMETAGKKISSLPRLFEEAANAIGTGFLPILASGVDMLSSFLKIITPENVAKISEALQPFFGYLGSQVELFKALFNGLGEGFMFVWDAMKFAVDDFMQTLNTTFNLGAANSDKFKLNMQVLGKAIGVIVAAIVIAILSVAGAILKINNALQWIIGKVAAARNSISGAFSSIGSSIATSFKNAINSAISFMNTGLNRIIGAYNAIPILGNIPFVNIPRFAQGGIVGGSSTSGDKVLARVNSGEMVLNKSQQSNLFNLLKNMSMSQNIAFNAPINFAGQSSPMQQENQFVNLLMNIAR